MKRYLPLLLLLLLAANMAAAQVKRSKLRNHPIRRTHAVLKREKFDPKRVPKDDLEKAVAAAGKSGKRIVLDVGGEWCSWCIHMDKYIAAHRPLARLRSQNFIWIKV